MSFLQNIFRRLVRGLLPGNSIEKILKVQICESGAMKNAIELWQDMYKNEPPWKGGPNKTVPLNLPAVISSEFARLILTEFRIEISGSQMAEYLDDQLKKSTIELSKFVEWYCAGGGIAIKPYVSGVDENGRPTEIKLDFVRSVDFFPCAYNNEMVTAAVFVEGKKVGDYLYTRLEYHELNGKQYTITNKAFRSEQIYQYDTDGGYTINDRFQSEVSLSSVPEWAGLSEEPVGIGNVDKPLFVYIKVPTANNIDTGSPLGVAVFSRAVDVIEQTDKQYGRILWEYKATEAGINADESLFKTDRWGKPILPEGEERLFRTFDFDQTDGASGYIQEYAPAIRYEAQFKGLNKQLQLIELLVGLAPGTLSEMQDVEKTATEIKNGKQRSYHTVNAMQQAWQRGFEGLIEAMRTLAVLYDIVPDGETELNCSWGDGVLEDTEAEYQRRWAMCVSGKLKTEDFLQWYFGCSKEEALAMMPEQKPQFPEEE